MVVWVEGRCRVKRFIASAVVLASGCMIIQTAPWGRRGIVMNDAARSDQARAEAVWHGRADPWAEIGTVPSGAIGVESGFSGGVPGTQATRTLSATRRPPDGTLSGAELTREVEVLAARVERLERTVARGAEGAGANATAGADTRAAAATPSPARLIYKVHPDGQTAWVHAGSTSGLKPGQTFRVTRGGKAVAQVRVARIWPNVAELSVLWANGKLARGDSVVPAAE